ncbi:hypothetical protein AAZX31_10G136400 [Glycine max]
MNGWSCMEFSVDIHSMGSRVVNPTLKREGEKENGYQDLDIDTCVMAFDDNDESSKKQKEPRVKNKVSHKGKHKAFGYEDLSVENLGQCDEDPNGMDYDSVIDPHHEEPNPNFREMHDLEIGYETVE